MKRIHESLRLVLQRHRIVFWYDETREWEKAHEAFSEEGVSKLTVQGTEFGTKVVLHRAPETRFLVYLPIARPPDAQNWLLDFLLQGHEYKADRASLAVQAAGLSYALRPVVEAHLSFFDEVKRVEALSRVIVVDEEPPSLRRKMMAVTVNAEQPEIDAILMSFLVRHCESSSEDLLDPVQASFGSMGLDESFWKEVALAFDYRTEKPTLHDFARTLFRAANPLDRGVRLGTHAQVFLQRWKDSQANSPAYRTWADRMEKELNLRHQLETVESEKTLGDCDTFAAMEQFVLHRLCLAFNAEGQRAEDILASIKLRYRSFWYPEHRHGYAALEHAVALRQLIGKAELRVESVDVGINRYVTTWFRIDTAYRKFHFHAKKYGQVSLLERMVEQVEASYLSNFLLPLADRWADQVATLPRWPGEVSIPKQTDFFDHYVSPYVSKHQKVCVVISDALRYEIAVELMAGLLSENRWKAELEPMLGVLPSYTQLGMAALLPGKVRALDPNKRTVSVDGRESAGIDARREILASTAGTRATALQAEAFMELNTSTEARALIRDHELVYLYHNVIDATGDSLSTEAQTCEAVETALESLLKLLKKLANANATHVLLTADHGFLFQQSEVTEGDDQPLPVGVDWLFPSRRFALGSGLNKAPKTKVFTAQELGLTGDWVAAFPLSLGRFPLRGSGKRYVHGGISLQEIVIPVLRIQKTRVDDTGRVDIDLLRAPTRITTGRLSLTLYQDRPIAAKILPRTLRIGISTVDGTPISEVKTLLFNSADPETRHRETTVDLALSGAADAHNGREVEIRLEDVPAGSQSAVPYKAHRLKLQKPFASDFDEL